MIRHIHAKVVGELINLNVEPGLRLRSISVENGIVSDYGLIVDQRGQKPVRVDSMVINDNGDVFMMGEWRMRSRKDKSLLYEHRSRSYRELPTGQSFAVGLLQ